MSEKRLIIDELELEYRGLFDINGLLNTIDDNTAMRGYSKSEKRRFEVIKNDAKEFSIELRPTKRKTEYYALMIKIRLAVCNIKDIMVKKDKVEQKMHQGDIKIIFDAWTTTDFEGRWEQKPGFYFLRTLFEKGIYKFHTDKYLDELIDDTHYIYNNVKAYLNLNRF